MIQMAINTLSSAAIIAPAAVAFTLVFTLFRYANFAVGGFVTIGAFAAWTINVPLGLPLWIAGVGAMIVCAVALAMSDRLVFRPLRGRGGGTLLLVSIALSFVLENIVRFIYGAQMKGFDIPLTGPLVIWGARITRETFAVVSVSLLAIVAVGALLVLTPIGRALRAVADNPSLANVRGLPVPRVEVFGIAVAGALLGLSGALVGVDLSIDPNLNWAVTIPIIAAAIVGGLGSPVGAAAGAVIIGLAEELTVAFLSPTYKGAVGFAVIALVLMLRPQGLLGDKVERK
ncbi:MULTISPECIES: branched-chain amino acid ABC transporter permease [Rhodopseudomonas]|uniref:Amino acid ABC transporter LivHM family permease n=1 Tax=Rhodopseudomonas palustris TaxID=1076 RepID=A0A0D7F4Z9_RHOPL|nr:MULTISPECIES: branched-chain amino acid ABC transporter permease [Rhodopseudomonas]KIZ47866.1 amino acid ABC transporter LivHM family permease [Rhodopseudomonas palustris]WOK17673.1 branched-chain amino acid ABC transporter permease [Rhodopseudomonas sp. BAL398]